MELTIAVERLTALAQASRLQLFRYLVQQAPAEISAGQLASVMQLPKATLSFHLKALTQCGLLNARQQGRQVLYSPALQNMAELLNYLTENCCAGSLCGVELMNPKPFNVLVLCTGNSARSIMAEAAFNDAAIGGGKFTAYSAGSQPTGKPNPGALRLLQRHQLSLDARSKSWDEFATPDAPKMDFIITVCGNAAGELCPVWPGQPTTAHWGVDDPAAATGTEAEIDAAFEAAYDILKQRIAAFAALPLETMTAQQQQQQAMRIGKTVGADSGNGR